MFLCVDTEQEEREKFSVEVYLHRLELLICTAVDATAAASIIIPLNQEVFFLYFSIISFIYLLIFIFQPCVITLSNLHPSHCCCMVESKTFLSTISKINFFFSFFAQSSPFHLIMLLLEKISISTLFLFYKYKRSREYNKKNFSSILFSSLSTK